MTERERFEPKEEEIEADDYRAFFESNILRVWHLQGKERVYRITRVTALTTEIGQGRARKTTRQPKLELATKKGATVPLPLLLNKTNAKTIAQLYGKRPSDWVGRWIALYPTTTDVGGETHDCIRVRNEIPGAPSRTNKQGGRVLPKTTAPEPDPNGDDAGDAEPPIGDGHDDTPESDHAIIQ
jgi:hypothetical protein